MPRFGRLKVRRPIRRTGTRAKVIRWIYYNYVKRNHPKDGFTLRELMDGIRLNYESARDRANVYGALVKERKVIINTWDSFTKELDYEKLSKSLTKNQLWQKFIDWCVPQEIYIFITEDDDTYHMPDYDTFREYRVAVLRMMGEGLKHGLEVHRDVAGGLTLPSGDTVPRVQKLHDKTMTYLTDGIPENDKPVPKSKRR